MPKKTLGRGRPAGEAPDEPGGWGPLKLVVVPDSVRPAVDVAAWPVLAVASLRDELTVCVGEEGPVDTRVGEGDEDELTLTEGDGETTALTVVVELRVPEDEPEVDEPEPPEELVRSVPETVVDGVGEVEPGRDAETDAEIGDVEADAETGWDVDSSEPGLGTCTETERTSAPAAPAPPTPRAPATSARESLMPALLIRDASNIRP